MRLSEKEGKDVDFYLSDLVVVVQDENLEKEPFDESLSIPLAVYKAEIGDGKAIDYWLLNWMVKLALTM